MPEHVPQRIEHEKYLKWMQSPVKDATGRVRHIVLLDEAEIEKIVDKGASKKRIDKIASAHHKQKTKEAIAQMEDAGDLTAEMVLSTLVEGATAYLDDSQARKLSKDKRVKLVEAVYRIPSSGLIWTDINTIGTSEIAPWGVQALGGPFSIGNATYNGLSDTSPVFVIDSGVHPHQDLNLVRRESVNGLALSGCYAHATFVAGIIGAMDSNGRSNVASAAQGASAISGSQYSPAYSANGAIDGDRSGINWGAGGGWNNATPGAFPEWLQVNFDGIKTIDTIKIYNVQDAYWSPREPTAEMSFSQSGLTSFSVQYYVNGNWANVPGGAVTGNNLVMRSFSFPPVNTSAIRVVVHETADGYSRLVEIEAHAPPNSILVKGVRPNTPIHSIAAGDSTVAGGCSPSQSADLLAGMERVKLRVKERCQQLGDCRPGIANLSLNGAYGAPTSNGSAFAMALSGFTGIDWYYPGTLLIHSAGNNLIPAANATVFPSPSNDGYLRIGGIDQNGQQVRPINTVNGFLNSLNNGDFTGSLSAPGELGSNYGLQVDIWAAAKSIRSTTTSNNVGVGSGTSFSAPLIAGLAAKLRETMPNNSNAGELEQLVRTKLIATQATDISGAAIKTAQINTSPWRAKPTVELYFPNNQPEAVYENPSKPTVSVNLYTDQLVSMRMEGLGSNVCDTTATWNGNPWFSYANITPMQNYQNINLNVAGTGIWSFTCRDQLDSNIRNTATATFNVQQAPPLPQLTWYVNGVPHTNPTTPYLVTRSAGQTLGFFTLQIVAVNASSCSLNAYTGGYFGWPAVEDFPTAFALNWYGPVLIPPSGFNWESVGLYPNKYTWVATCANNRGKLVSVQTHITVQ